MIPRLEFYIDTNVLLDWLEPVRGNRTSEFVRERIRTESGFVAVVSTFALMEAVQQHQDYTHFRSLAYRGYLPSDIPIRERDLPSAELARCYSDVYNLVDSLKSKAVIRRIDATEVWTEATSLQQRTNLSAPDAIHVGVALATGCDFFVTRDQQLLRELRAFLGSSKRLILIPTQKGDLPPKFAEHFERSVELARKRRPRRHAEGVPKEMEDLIVAVAPLLSKGEDRKKFIKRFESRLRRYRRRAA